MGDEHNFISPFCQGAAYQVIALTNVDGNNTIFPDVAEFAEIASFHHPQTGGEDHEFVGIPRRVLIGFPLRRNAEHRSDFFLRAEVQQVLDAAAFGSAGAFGNQIDPLRINAAAVSEKHEPIVRAGGEKMLDKVADFLLVHPAGLGGFHALQSLATAALAAELGCQGALDIPPVGDRDNHPFIGNQIHEVDLAFFRRKIR